MRNCPAASPTSTIASVLHEAMLLGAGQRGRHAYGAYASRNPNRLRFVAVAEPDEQRRRIFAEEHSIPASRRFADGLEMLDVEPARACIIATPDRHHAAPAIAALEQGLDVLLEKPVAHSLRECSRVLNAARLSSGSLTVGHVLRYTPFFSTLNRLIGSGRLGRLITVEHREDVVYWHTAHSFVRGNWARAADSSPMIVQKCCHDFDILAWNLATAGEGTRVNRVQSFGSRLHFRPEHAPAGATARCTDPCPVASDCPFDAARLYLDPERTGWPVHAVTEDLSPRGRLRALREGPYGRCVYTAGSDVVDHQTVSMRTSSGATAVLVMNGHASHQERTARYHGSRGTVVATFGRHSTIEFTDHLGGAVEKIPIITTEGGHGGGDSGLIEAFLDSLETATPSDTSTETWFESHLLAFTAEQARLTGTTLNIDRIRSDLGKT